VQQAALVYQLGRPFGVHIAHDYLRVSREVTEVVTMFFSRAGQTADCGCPKRNRISPRRVLLQLIVLMFQIGTFSFTAENTVIVLYLS
jgi:hypothetical protein